MSEQKLRQEVSEMAILFKNKEVTDEEILSRIKTISQMIYTKLPSLDNLFQESITEKIFGIIGVLIEMRTDIHLKCEYNNILESFIKLLFGSPKSEFENWNKFLDSIDTWKTDYLISSDKFTLNGVSGWYWEASYWKFIACKEVEYVPIILLICWLISFDNEEFVAYTMKEITIEEVTLDSLTILTKDDFFDELTDQYQKSFKNFENYLKGENTNPIVIEKFTAEYPRFINYYNNLKNSLRECSVFRINGLENDENVWYFLKEDNYMHIILIQDFM